MAKTNYVFIDHLPLDNAKISITQPVIYLSIELEAENIQVEYVHLFT